MPENALPLLALKMAIAASIVVSASVIAERARPFIAAMIATLPVSAGPAFAFLALDHDAAFMQATLTGALVTNIATAGFSLAYVLVAAKLRTLPALATSLAIWAFGGIALRGLDWSLGGAFLASAGAFLLAIPLARRFATNDRVLAPPRAWFAIPLRAAAVAVLVALVTTLSWSLGPHLSGMLAVFPIVLSSIIVILQPRIGGAQTAALVANGLVGLLGFGLGIGAAALTTPALGSLKALGVGLGVCLAWNGAIVVWRLLRVQPPSTSPRSR